MKYIKIINVFLTRQTKEGRERRAVVVDDKQIFQKKKKKKYTLLKT
jgi:hypothetical protein